MSNRFRLPIERTMRLKWFPACVAIAGAEFNQLSCIDEFFDVITYGLFVECFLH